MYGVPTDLPLHSFVGSECSHIGLGQWQIQFHFIGSGGIDVGNITIEGRWELREQSGEVIDRSQEPSERKSYCVHKIFGLPITHFVNDAPKSFTLFFRDGFSLTVYDDSEQYESFSLYIEQSKQNFWI